MVSNTSDLIKRIVWEFESINNETRLDKFRLVKTAIIKSLVISSPDDRFPPIRTLSKALGITQVPVQKAITELIAENRLYSKGRVGLFVKTPTDNISMNLAFDQKKNFTIFFDDRSENIQSMMYPVLKLLREKLDRLEIGLFFNASQESNFDIYIQSSLPPNLKALNLAKSAELEVRRGNLTLADDFNAPLASQTYYFVWNRKLLAKEKFPEPSYTTFSEQKEYFKELSKCFKLPVLSWLRPDFLLGKQISEIIATLKTGCSHNSRQGKSLAKRFNDVLEFCSMLEYEKNGRPVNSFIRGQRVGMILQTTSFFDLEPEINNLDLGYSPVLSHDNSLILLPIPIKLPAVREVFYDGIQILKALQSEEIQQEFFKRNYITAQGKAQHLPDTWRVSEENSYSIISGNDTANYLRDTVIRFEMLMTGIYAGDYETAIENIFGYSRSVINNFPEKENEL
jgi:DNA-binding transcriptional regulator YhcF (GntR family)